MDPKEGRRPKAATIFLSKYCLKIVPGVLFDNILTIFGPLGKYFLSTFRGPSKIVGFQYFDNFQTICPGPLRDGPKSSKINILTIFQHFRKYLSVAGPVQYKSNGPLEGNECQDNEWSARHLWADLTNGLRPPE